MIRPLVTVQETVWPNPELDERQLACTILASEEVILELEERKFCQYSPSDGEYLPATPEQREKSLVLTVAIRQASRKLATACGVRPAVIEEARREVQRWRFYEQRDYINGQLWVRIDLRLLSGIFEQD